MPRLDNRLDSEEVAFKLALRWSGMTMVDVGKGAGVTKSSVGNWITGKIPAGEKTRANLWRVLGYERKLDGLIRFLPDTWRRCIPDGKLSEDEVEAWLDFLKRMLGWQLPGALIGRWIQLPGNIDLIEYWLADQRVAAYHVVSDRRFDCYSKYFEQAAITGISAAEVFDWIHAGARPPDRLRKLLRIDVADAARSPMHGFADIDWNVWIGLMLEARQAGLSPDKVRARLGLKVIGSGSVLQKPLAVPVAGQDTPRTEWTNPIGQWVWVGR